MSTDLWQDLAEQTVPPVPDDLPARVHSRLNDRLVVTHVTDFALGALPASLMLFSEAVLGLLSFTAGGEYGEGNDKLKIKNDK